MAIKTKKKGRQLPEGRQLSLSRQLSDPRPGGVQTHQNKKRSGAFRCVVILLVLIGGLAVFVLSRRSAIGSESDVRFSEEEEEVVSRSRSRPVSSSSSSGKSICSLSIKSTSPLSLYSFLSEAATQTASAARQREEGGGRRHSQTISKANMGDLGGGGGGGGASSTTPFVVVYVTVPNKEVGEKIAQSLVEKRLAACVNILPGVTSIYTWQGKIEKDSELLLVIKTRASLIKDLEKHVAAEHPYDVPELIALPIVQGSAKYLTWLSENTQEATTAGA